MLVIRTTFSIVTDILVHKQSIRNFPKSMSFPVDKIYANLATQIKTLEISAECILYDSVQAYNTTKLYSDPEYWAKRQDINEIADYWIFGQNGQGDLWILDVNGKVYFYDHNQEQMCKDNFVALDLNFEKWLQFADLNRQLDEIYNDKIQISEDDKLLYKHKLREISELLFANYPFEI